MVPHPSELRKAGTFGEPDLNHHFVQEPHLDHFVIHLFKNDWLAPEDKGNLMKSHPDYHNFAQAVEASKDVDFSPLRQYRGDWIQQKNIPASRVKMFTACLIGSM